MVKHLKTVMHTIDRARVERVDCKSLELVKRAKQESRRLEPVLDTV